MSQEQVISASLLKKFNIVLGSVLPCFNIGMDNWIDYDLLSDSRSHLPTLTRKRAGSGQLLMIQAHNFVEASASAY